MLQFVNDNYQGILVVNNVIAYIISSYEECSISLEKDTVTAVQQPDNILCFFTNNEHS